MQTLSDSERLDWLQLIRTESIGPITFHRLVKKFGTPRKVLEALPDISRKSGRKRAIKIASRQDVEDELSQADRAQMTMIAFCEPSYPASLSPIPDPPPVLYVKGHSSLFEKRGIAIIGARNASGVGRKLAKMLAADLGEKSFSIVSGLARGIDGAAHEASLTSGTIAVVAGGADVVYPPEHAELTAEIGNRGAIVSERPPGFTPTARDFPRRNRLISGLSQGVIVVEAAARSGTLITARFALEQGREVFAVPGSPLDPRCQGANNLIRDGATLVQTAQDVIDALSMQTRGLKASGPKDLFDWAQDEVDQPSDEHLRQQILETLSYTPQHRDEILRAIDAPPGLIIDGLISLVLSGEAEEQSGGRFALLSS